MLYLLTVYLLKYIFIININKYSIIYYTRSTLKSEGSLAARL